MIDESSVDETKRQKRTNLEKLGECLNLLLESLRIVGRRQRLAEQMEDIFREESRLREEQYPCDEGGTWFFDQDFEFEWM